ncbi:hypothetical protein HanIR_Chr11g0514821 [Helianthus annuus]|nr:hypothetical protein HanIR_Chr11g0514821 [Helianthus annuus]
MSDVAECLRKHAKRPGAISFCLSWPESVAGKLTINRQKGNNREYWKWVG